MRHAYPFDHRHDAPWLEIKSLIGSKAANLGVMAAELGLPVPPGFTITTQACNGYLAGGWPDGLEDEIREHMGRLEAALGRRFGDPADPLLVSVRSGAPVSMPGMMDTILNLGLNAATEAGLAAASGDPEFAAQCHARFRTMYRDIVRVEEIPEDPLQQLRAAIEAVFRSWNSDRAKTYRQHEGISDDLGTAVTIQAMVFGNRGTDSGTGVLFTRNPSTGEPVLYGDVMFGAQGEDVVAGTHHTESLDVLDVRMPAVADELKHYCVVLEHHFTDCCDIEFTIERGKLWMLQVRVGKRSPQAALRMAVDMAEDADFPLTRREAVERVKAHLAHPPLVSTGRPAGMQPLATGLPASPGVATGEVATTPDAAEALADAGRAVVLVRAETSPDDVHGMAKAVGLLTSKGGLASHAAVVARGWGIPAVVGAAGVRVADDGVSIGGRMIALGSAITIDGSSGEVFEGIVAGSTSIAPEAAKLLAWAADLGISVAEGAGEAATPTAPAIDPCGATREDALRAMAIKGYVTPESLSTALLSTPEEVAAILDSLVADGLAELAAGSFRLTSDGKTVAREHLAEDRDAWGIAAAIAALDAFLALDARMKAIVTAWQMREVDGAQTFNDHSDAAYDAGVLADLGALHADTRAWIAPLGRGLPRLGAYAARLDRAATLAADGDGRYLASPRVDSYHGVWFELHEDLIGLSGRTRADEVAAGRA